MEGDGERVHPIPAEPRRKVLRAGVRIVADQFAPYSDEPDELQDGWFLGGAITAGTINASQIQSGTIQWNSPRAFGKGTSMHQALEDLQAAAKAIEENSFRPTAQRMRGLGRLLGWVDEATPEPPPKKDNKPRDRRPKKRKKQDEPGYVKLTRERRRR